MAIHIMELNGKIANVVFYTRYGKNLARKAPKEFKRTKAMQLRSKNFGIAASTARKLRVLLHKAIPFPKDKAMQSELSGTITRWIGKREIKNILPETNIALLADFQFNKKYNMRNRWKLIPEVLNPAEGILQLQIPAFTPMESIVAPEGTVSVNLQVSIATDIPDSPHYGEYFDQIIEIAYDDAETGPYLIDLPVKMEKGSFIVTAIAFQYQVKHRGNILPETRPDWLPAMIVDARYY